MSKFKLNDYKVNTEVKDVKEVKILKLDQDATPVVKDFQFNQLQSPNRGNYQKVKTKYGPLASTDQERESRGQKDRRFSINPLLKTPLSIEQEERRVIDEKVRAQLTAVTEEAKAQAMKLGFQEGFKKGYEDAFKKTQIEGTQSLKKFDQLLAELEGAKADIYRANERFLVEIMYRVARMVLLRELKTDKEYLLRLIKELIQRVGVRDHIVVRISPEDAESIAKLKENVEKIVGGLNNFNIEVSSQVKQGGCRIETEWNAIETHIDQQLEGIHEALVGKPTGGET
jgi:flagellar assembly protein FliH